MKFLRKAKSASASKSTAAEPPASAPAPGSLNAKPLRDAVAALDFAYADVADFRQTKARWESEYQWAQENLNPERENELLILRGCRDKTELAPYHLKRAEAQIPAALDRLLLAVRTFDKQVIAAMRAEGQRVRAAIIADREPALTPVAGKYRIDAHDAAARLAVSYFGLRHVGYDHADLQANPDDRYLASLERSAGFSRPVETEHPAYASQLADFERVVVSRAAALLSVAAVWEQRGGRFMPDDPSEPAVAFKPSESASVRSLAPAVDLAATKLNLHGMGGQMMPSAVANVPGGLGGIRLADSAEAAASATLPTGDVSQADIARLTGHDLNSLGGGNLGGSARVARSVGGPDQLGGTPKGDAATVAAGPDPVAANTGAAPVVDLGALKL